jgi:hypothetical protein
MNSASWAPASTTATAGMHGGHSRTPSNQSVVKYISYYIQNSVFRDRVSLC